MSEGQWFREERVELERDLTPEELRVLGCLMEKEAATPEYYPLTLNALVTACNQTSNRDPVVNYEPDLVIETLDRLRARKLARIVHSPSGRAPKYKHVLEEALGLNRPRQAVLTVMMLRGPQTLNELRTRTERLHPFESNAEVEALLDRMREEEHPLVARMERQPGQKEARYAHLLAGEPVMPAPSADRENLSSGQGRSATVERLESLEAQVAALTAEVEELRRRLDEVL